MTGPPPLAGQPGPLRDLLDAGVVPLPTLSREELAAVGEAGRCPLRDVAEEHWWDRLCLLERHEATAAGRRSLYGRGLVSGADGGDVAPDLAAVLAVRSNPALVAVLGQPGRDAAQAPRVFGALSADGRLDWLLVERVRDGRHDATAVTPGYAVEAVTGWLAGPHRTAGSRIETALGPLPGGVDGQVAVDGPSGGGLVRTLEVMRPVPSEPGPARSRLVVLSTPTALAVCPVGAHGEAGPPGELDRDALRDLVAAAFRDRPG